MTARIVQVLGGPGSGVTTLGRELAVRLGLQYRDVDDFHWVPSVPPYQRVRTIHDKYLTFSRAIEQSRLYVVGGSLDGWADALSGQVDLVVFLMCPQKARMERIIERERDRFADAIQPGGAMHQRHSAFLDWAAGYDHRPAQVLDRSLARDVAWISRLNCPGVTIPSGTFSLDMTLQVTVSFLTKVSNIRGVVEC